MSKKLLTIVIVLIVVNFLVAAAAIFFIKTRQSEETTSDSRQVFFATDGGLEQVPEEYGDLEFDTANQYLLQTLKADFHPQAALTPNNLQLYPREESVRYRSSPWKVDSLNLFLETFRTIKGERHSESGKAQEYTIYVQEEIADFSLEDSVELIQNYFTMPRPLSEAQRKDIVTVTGGNVIEYVWEFVGYKETRAIANESNMRQFWACRVFPDSDFFERGTCVYQP